MMHEMKRQEFKGYTYIISENEDENVQWEVHGKDGYESGEDGHNTWGMAEDSAKEYIKEKIKIGRYTRITAMYSDAE